MLKYIYIYFLYHKNVDIINSGLGQLAIIDFGSDIDLGLVRFYFFLSIIYFLLSYFSLVHYTNKINNTIRNLKIYLNLK